MSAKALIFSVYFFVSPLLSPLWHQDGGFAEDAAVNEEEELDGALLDDDEGVALPDAAAPGKTCCIAPG